MKKINLLKESIIATVIIFFLTVILIKIPFSLEYGKALHQGFADFDIYDLHYSGNQSTSRDTNVIIVEESKGFGIRYKIQDDSK